MVIPGRAALGRVAIALVLAVAGGRAAAGELASFDDEPAFDTAGPAAAHAGRTGLRVNDPRSLDAGAAPSVVDPRCGGDTNLVVRGSVGYAPPGCSDGSVIRDFASEITCSGLTPTVTREHALDPVRVGCEDAPLRRSRVELWVKESFTFQYFDATTTDAAGDFVFCLYNPPGNSVDLFVSSQTCSDGVGDRCGSLAGAPTEFSVVATTSTNTIYNVNTSSSPARDVCTGTVEWNLADRRADSSGAEHVFDLLANEAFDTLEADVGFVNDGRLQVRFPDASTGFSIPSRIVQIASGDQQDDDVVLRMYALYVLYLLYGGVPPATPNCLTHEWGTPSSSGCAWVHGWSYFLQAAMQRDRTFVDTAAPGGEITHLRDLESLVPPAADRKDEGAVAATLWDVFDTPLDAEGWDAVAFGLEPIWSTVAAERPADVCAFHDAFVKPRDPATPLLPIFDHHGIHCPVRYAALGDSYSSGENVPDYFFGTDTETDQCHRSENAYATKIRTPGNTETVWQLAVGDPEFDWKFIACSGAETKNVKPYAKGGVWRFTEPPQLDQGVVMDTTNMVSITIGGNDVAFGPAVERCLFGDCTTEQAHLPYGTGTWPEVLAARVAQARTDLESVYRDIRSSAQDAAVFVLNYPVLVGDASCLGTFGRFGLSQAERLFIVSAGKALDDAIRAATTAAGVQFVGEVSQRFRGHEVCAPKGQEWISGAKSPKAASFHPNERGQLEYGRALMSYLEAKRNQGWEHGFLCNGLPRNPPEGAARQPAAMAVTPSVLVAPTWTDLEVSADPAPPCVTRPGWFARGQTLRLRASGFAAGDLVYVRVKSQTFGVVTQLGTLHADGQGALDASIALPVDLGTLGSHLLDAVGAGAAGAGHLASTEITIASSPTADADADGAPDLCDNCPHASPAIQTDSDDDGNGDVCDPCPGDYDDDLDADGACAPLDPCPYDPENDGDGDGVCESEDNCPLDGNADQADDDGDGRGNACEGAPCYTLALDSDPAESGTVVGSSPTCGLADYQAGTNAKLLASPNEGFEFVGWLGDVVSTANPLVVPIGASLHVIAKFQPMNPEIFSDGFDLGDTCAWTRASPPRVCN
ncbi:MAG: GDSL-type esterase/lipase family protein [bacterium]